MSKFNIKDFTLDDWKHVNEDLNRVLEFFFPIMEDIREVNNPDEMESYYFVKWDEESRFWKSTGICGTPSILPERGALESLLNSYVTRNESEWKELLAECQIIGSFLDEELLIKFIERIFRRFINGDNIENAFNLEFDELRMVQDDCERRIQKIILQNVTLKEKEQVFFWDKEVDFKGKKGEFTVKINLRIRVLTKKEFEEFGFDRKFFGLFRKSYISAIAEISYSFPKWIMETRESFQLEGMLNSLRDNLFSTLRLLNAKNFHPVVYQPCPANYYQKYLFPEGIYLIQKRFKESFFSEPIIIENMYIDSFKEVMDLLWDLRNRNDFYENFELLSRIDALMEVGRYESLVFFVSFIEKLTGNRGWLLCYQVSWLNGLQNSNERLEEVQFWKIILRLRNMYVHGNSMESISRCMKKEFPNQNIMSLIRILYEKTARITLFCLLLIVMKPNERDFRRIIREWSDNCLLGSKSELKEIKRYSRWIKKDTKDELGKKDKFKAFYGLKPLMF